METLPVRRKSCLLRLRENCPFRKLRRQTYAQEAAASSAIGSDWNNVGPSTSNQSVSTVWPQPLPPLVSVCPSYQSGAAADIHMEDDAPPAENRADDWMELGSDVDPETGERAQG